MTTTPVWTRLNGGPVASGDEAVATLRELLRSGITDVTFVANQGRSIQIVTNGDRAMLVWWGREGFDEGMFAFDVEAPDVSVTGFVLANGQADAYSMSQTVPLDRAIDALCHAIDHDQPDGRLSWRSW